MPLYETDSLRVTPASPPNRTSAAGHDQRHLYVWDRLVLQLAPGLANARHRHFGAFVLLAPDATIEIEVDREPRVIAQAALVAPHAWHRLDSSSSRVATLLVGSDHPWFGYVSPALSGPAIVPLDFPRIAGGVDWDRLFGGDEDCAQVFAFVERSLAAILDRPLVPHALEPRIAMAVDILASEAESASDIAKLGRRVGLSPVTLMRRFKQALGVRIREYALWRRLMNVLPLIDGRRSLTEIAQLAGFYDQAHLTRTSRRMFDLQPSVVSNARRARVHVCTCDTSAHPGHAVGTAARRDRLRDR